MRRKKRRLSQARMGLPATSLSIQRSPASMLVWWMRRSEEHTSELQSRLHLVCRLLLENKKKVRSRKRHTRRPEVDAHLEAPSSGDTPAMHASGGYDPDTVAGVQAAADHACSC